MVRATISPPVVEKRRVILDKNFVEGGKKEAIVALCRDGRALMPDVLFYEMLTGSEPGRSRCFAKFPGVNPVPLVPNVGTLQTFELDHHRACGLPSAHGEPIDYRFNPKLFTGNYELPEEGKTTLRDEEERLRGELPTLIEMINMAPSLFPDVFNKALDREAALAEVEHVLANDESAIVRFYAGLEPPDASIKPVPASLLTKEWVFFRLLQVKLWASLDLRLRLGELPREIAGERRHRLENYLFDMQYGVLGLLEGGLATEDDWLRRLFKIFRPDGLLLPTDEDLAAKRESGKFPIQLPHRALKLENNNNKKET
jgi:hypothetical protein